MVARLPSYSSSFWIPLALAEVTSYLHFMTDTGTAIDDAQAIKKHIDKVFIVSCMVANIMRNASWVTRLGNGTSSEIVWAFQHLYFGVEEMTLLNIRCTMKLLNLAKYQNQEKVNVSLLGLTILLTRRIAQYDFFYCPRWVLVYLNYGCNSGTRVDGVYTISWYEYRVV